jgi:hypothetical protein
MAEKAPVSQVREPREIVTSQVHLLHERGFCVDNPARFQHPANLLQTPGRIDDMLEHGLDHNPVECSSFERQIVGIADQAGPGTARDVRLYHGNPRVADQFADPFAGDAASHHQDVGTSGKLK